MSTGTSAPFLLADTNAQMEHNTTRAKLASDSSAEHGYCGKVHPRRVIIGRFGGRLDAVPGVYAQGRMGMVCKGNGHFRGTTTVIKQL